MSISMYDASIPVFVRLLGNLSAILAKAEKYAETKKIDPTVLVNSRLAPDMFPLSRQIQIATDVSKGCAARLAGIDAPVYPDTEMNIPELQARIAKTIHFFQGIKASEINGSEQREIKLKLAAANKICKDSLTYSISLCLIFIFTSQPPTQSCVTMALISEKAII